MKRTAFKKKFASLMCCILSLTCVLGSIPVSASTPESAENLALHCSYETSGAADASYPDSGGELTDGIEGTGSYSDNAWSAYLYVADLEITLDLGETKDFSKVEGVFLNSMSSGGIPYPEWVRFSYSNDKQTWTEIVEESFAETAPFSIKRPFRIPYRSTCFFPACSPAKRCLAAVFSPGSRLFFRKKASVPLT